MEGFQGLPYPPDCAHCGGRIGMWEPVVTEPTGPTGGNVSTTWLKLCEEGRKPRDLWHLVCRAPAQGSVNLQPE